MATDYNDTIHLPKTGFPMRAGLPKREPEQLEAWEERDNYGLMLERTKDRPLFILHDGPPYANADIHMGTALNKVLKDFIVRYKSMSGFHAPFIPGWDTHGLPIENAVLKSKKATADDANAFRDKCREYAEKSVDSQRGSFKRLGCVGDWAEPYITCTPSFEAKQVEVFGAMAMKGYIYKGLKPVYWCPHHRTALAEAEIEYQNVGNESIYVKFRVADDNGLLAQYAPLDKLYFVIWTTTAWTLPGNFGISLNPDLDYALARTGNETYIIAEALLPRVREAAGLDDVKVLATLKGVDFDRMTARHPFMDRDSLIMVGDHVTAEEGTGCVHTAPGHGAEDFVIGKAYGLPVVTPVDGKGVMTADAGRFEGLFYEKASGAILDELENSGALLARRRIEHSYAHCWRCKNPVLFRATEQWFASVDAIKDRVCEEIGKIAWYPAWGRERLTAMVRERADWCISRQRKWGVPIPIFFCEDCGKPYYNADTFKAVAGLFREKGSNAWFENDAAEILPKGSVCGCGCSSFTKETDIMDVWFDSGTSHASVLERPGQRWPADMYLEGGDQFRGWFQSSILTSVAAYDQAPYKSVVCNGWVVDGDGRKMSKSLGNGMEPSEVINRYGADLLRLWAASGNYHEDVRVSMAMFGQLSEVYLKMRNTARFLLGNLSDFDPVNDAVPYDKLEPLDKWALWRLNTLVKTVLESYERYSFHPVFNGLHNFCVTDLSNFYLDVLKDRLYCEKKDGLPRRAAQTALYRVLGGLTRLMAPILCFTAEEIYSHTAKTPGMDARSVFLNDMPEYDPSLELSQQDAAYWEKVTALRDAVNAELEKNRAAKTIGKSLEAAVTLTASGEWADFLNAAQDSLPALLIVSQVKTATGAGAGGAGEGQGQIPVKIGVEFAAGEKCPRCWNYSEDAAQGANAGLCPRCASVLN